MGRSPLPLEPDAMRLTLRTLLAYLDDTLDPQDAEALKLKLTESGFATQLVQRIRESLNDHLLAAPSPDAVGPVEDANVISEYLDSTLSSEQVAEIERACLESDPHLAEAAACHQILTMVLGTPANVPTELRNRIYELPDRQIEEIASADNFSSIALPSEPSPDGPLADDIPTADAILSSNEPVKPVGAADSGVSDAPTRLRAMEIAEESSSAAAKVGKSDPATARSKPRPITESQIYGGSIRPSRIAPWLVSLAVAAVLLFALSQIFAPLLSRESTVAESMSDGISTPIADAEAPSEEPVSVSDTPLESPPPAQRPETVESDLSSSRPPTDQPSVEPEPSKPKPDLRNSSSADGPNGDDPDKVSPAKVSREGEPEPPMVEPSESDGLGEPEPEEAETEPSDSPETETDLAAIDPVEPKQAAKITSANGLVASLEGATADAEKRGRKQWTFLKKGAAVDSESLIVCAPTFRAEMMTSSNMAVTMIGPTRLRWHLGDEDRKTLDIETGRILLSAGTPQSTLDLVLSGQALRIEFDEATDAAAIEVTHYRQPGLDPLVPENRKPILAITSVQGTVAITGAGDHQLETGQQWTMVGTEEPVVSETEELPLWVRSPDDAADLTLEAGARKGLLNVLAEEDQSLEIALREAISFRQSEVGALAAQTLLALGRGDVYFGGDGILNQPKQRAYWLDHFAALQDTINQSGQSASDLRDSIEDMDSANAAPIMELLIGYSQQQLENGGDLALIEQLDSPSMAVRVLALENLRQITGKTLYFRAEQENEARRTQSIKKWTTQQRQKNIRWPQ